jgi:hypothetical protein
MKLLTDYVRSAIALGIIDEWHIWNFTRHPDDDEWVRALAPSVSRIPDDLLYYKLASCDQNQGGRLLFRAFVRTGNDAIFGVVPDYKQGSGPCFEIVIGGWGNHRCGIRRLSSRRELFQTELERGAENNLISEMETPGILSNGEYRLVEIELTKRGLMVRVEGNEVCQIDGMFDGPSFDVFARTGFGGDMDLRNVDGNPSRIALFHANRNITPIYSNSYLYYGRRLDEYRHSVFLKSDDDIVYMDIKRLVDFIAFRVNQPYYFIVSANVVNNGVCAYYQQKFGKIPLDLMELELPPGGFCGQLWANPQWAESLHRYFIRSLSSFSEYDVQSIDWNMRISINFIAWLGEDLAYMCAEFRDDEQALSVSISSRLKRPNTIYMPFVVSHLTFYSQDPGFAHGPILEDYRAVAERTLSRLSIT